MTAPNIAFPGRAENIEAGGSGREILELPVVASEDQNDLVHLRQGGDVISIWLDDSTRHSLLPTSGIMAVKPPPW